ncbi:MAG: hypothetical protein JO091_10400 [Acidobacteriaceae bacterium]|nr:hypothetical protein [Acidobacteriaceae bacterium]
MATPQSDSDRGTTPSALTARQIVAAHNVVRSRVGVPPLVWSDEVARTAQEWAETLLATGVFAHRGNSSYGENLFEASGLVLTPWQVVNAWASEAKDYEYAVNSCTSVCGHYTQIVWRDTRAVGCGIVRDGRREIWVCNYAPNGNIIGERPY